MKTVTVNKVVGKGQRFAGQASCRPTMRQPDLRARGSSPLKYAVVEGVTAAKIMGLLASGLRGR